MAIPVSYTHLDVYKRQDIDANAVREDINNIFDYVRPILSVGNIVFDVYD